MVWNATALGAEVGVAGVAAEAEAKEVLVGLPTQDFAALGDCVSSNGVSERASDRVNDWV